MHVFSTVLFVNGAPVGYQVIKEEQRLLLNPAENPSCDVFPPAMQATQIGGEWRVEGTNDRNLIDQVIEDVTTNEPVLRQAELSAAP